MIFKLPQAYKKIKRLNQILPVFFKYGFGWILKELKLDYYLFIGKNLFKIKKKSEFESLSNEKRFVLALQELGPTFIKLGQILSTREDIFPENWIKELETLQDHVAPVEYSKLKKIIKPLLDSEEFEYIDPIPIASASIAQVHKGKLKDGREVVIKIKRPGIDEIIFTDILLLFELANLIENHIPELKMFKPVKLVEEFSDTIRKELDFFREKQHMKNFRSFFENDEFLYIPEVYDKFCSEKYITMEFIDGIKINNFDELKNANIDFKYISEKWSEKVIEQVLVYGYFHADPHPGNIFVLKDNRIAYLDFGMIGRLTDEMKLNIANLIIGIAGKDVDLIVKTLKNMSPDFFIEDLTGFKRDLLDFIDMYYNVPLKEFNVGKVFKELFRILRKYQISIITDYVLLDKTILTLESIGRKLNPDFNLVEKAYSQVKKVLKEQKSIKRFVSKDIKKKLKNAYEFSEEIPEQILDTFRTLLSKNLVINFKHQGLEKFTSEMDRSINRLIFGLIISATLISSSFLIKISTFFGIIGFSFATFLGIWLLYGIFKSGRL